jgi:hypothetical protein
VVRVLAVEAACVRRLARFERAVVDDPDRDFVASMEVGAKIPLLAVSGAADPDVYGHAIELLRRKAPETIVMAFTSSPRNRGSPVADGHLVIVDEPAAGDGNAPSCCRRPTESM